MKEFAVRGSVGMLMTSDHTTADKVLAAEIVRQAHSLHNQRYLNSQECFSVELDLPDELVELLKQLEAVEMRGA